MALFQAALVETRIPTTKLSRRCPPILHDEDSEASVLVAEYKQYREDCIRTERKQRELTMTLFPVERKEPENAKAKLMSAVKKVIKNKRDCVEEETTDVLEQSQDYTHRIGRALSDIASRSSVACFNMVRVSS